MATILDGCVASLRSSMQLLDSSIAILDTGVSDFPRLSKVLQTTRHFELISEPSLHTAQSALHQEIHPEVSLLLSRVDNYLSKLERREQSLIAKCDLQQGRLSRPDDDDQRPSGARKSVASAAAAAAAAGGASLEGLKAQALRQKKERLSYAVERLTLQAQQRERQLRMSMAPQVRDMDF